MYYLQSGCLSPLQPSLLLDTAYHGSWHKSLRSSSSTAIAVTASLAALHDNIPIGVPHYLHHTLFDTCFEVMLSLKLDDCFRMQGTGATGHALVWRS